MELIFERRLMNMNAHSGKVYLIIFGSVKQIFKGHLLYAKGGKRSISPWRAQGIMRIMNY